MSMDSRLVPESLVFVKIHSTSPCVRTALLFVTLQMTLFFWENRKTIASPEKLQPLQKYPISKAIMKKDFSS